MLFTIAHELTHFIRQNSPAKFDALADIVVNKSNLKGKISERIEQKIKEAKDRGEPISRDTAYEEVIADSMETILTSGRVFELMNEIQQQDKTLWEQIRDWFMDFIKSIREAYKGVDADTVEGQAIAEMDDVLKELEQVFAEGLVDAGENFQTAEKNTTEGGAIKESIRRTQKLTLKEQLSAYYGKNFKRSDSFCFSMTPAVLARSGLNSHPLAMLQDDFLKSTRLKHNIPRRVLLRLEENLGKPIFSFTAGEQTAVAIDDIDGDGKPVIVAIHGGHNMDRKPVNLIKSIYGVDSMSEWVSKQIAGGCKFRVYDIEKANAMLQTEGYLAEVGTESEGFWDTITKIDRIVKSESAADLDISADAKTEAVAPAVLKSERIDTDGNQLSEDQQAYFADSKVRDADGKLQVMYRGDATDVNVFDRKKSRPSNLYGRGFYFTSSKSHAGQYGDARAFYLNIKNPLRPNQNSITREQMLKFLQAIEDDGEDYDLYNYGENATANSVLKSVWGKGDFEMLQDVSASAIGDLVAAVELFNSINGTDYDGLILPTETVIFQSEQAKLTSNKTPTSNPDIRYSNRVYGGIREVLAKKGLDELSKKYGSYFPLSASFDATMRADNTPLVIATVKANQVKRKGKESPFKAGKQAFRAAYGVHTSVHIKQMGIDAELFSNVASESIAKAKGLANEQSTLDVIPHIRDILSNSILMGVERIVHTDGKGTALYGYRLYNLYLYDDGKVKTPHCLACTVVQDLDKAEGYVFQNIENVTIDQGLPGNKTGMPSSVNGNTYTVAQLYRTVKKIDRFNGGLKYTAEERDKYLFSYTERNDGVKYSDRDTESVSNRSLLTNALEGVAQNEWEQNKLNEYKENIAKVEEMESRLQEINSQLYPYGKKMPQKERIALQDEAVGLRNKITNIDKKLLRLEATKPLQNVLNRERARVRREMKQKAEERISEVKAEAAQRLKRRSEGHAATEMRKKIRKTIRELDKILNRGDKKRNVKEDMKDRRYDRF